MKKLINRPEEVVADALHGLQRAHPQLLKVNFDPAFVVRADAPIAGKVGIVSGGGSGHEPLHSGFVGRGMLDAACPGAVFTSPTPDQILAATRAVDGGAGVLHIVKNYTGDVMNFDIAAELVADEGIEVASVVIDDDVAVENSIYTAGRRGVGATVLAEKIWGPRLKRASRLRASPTSAARSTSVPAAWVWRSPLVSFRPPAGRPLPWAKAIWRLVSGFTASPGASGCRCRAPTRSRTCCPR